MPARANFKVGDSLVINVRGQEQFKWVISDRAAVRKFDDGEAVIKGLKSSFLPLSSQDMPEDQHRLPLTLCTEVS